MWNLKEFESIYSRYESSGLKVRDFCTNEVINEAKFYYWQKKLRASKLPSASFVPIVPVSNSTTSDLSYPVNTGGTTVPVMLPPEYEILYPSGITLRLKGTVTPEFLKVLIQPAY